MIAAILAGGNSRRMGRDKALIEVDGSALIERTCRAAADAGLTALIVGRSPESLPPKLTTVFPCVPDDTPDSGPLGGLATAMSLHPGIPILLSACDLPLVSTIHFQWLLDQFKTLPADSHGVIPVYNKRFQPLFAIYKPELSEVVTGLLKSGNRAMHALLNELPFTHIPLPDHLAQCAMDADDEIELKRILSRREFQAP